MLARDLTRDTSIPAVSRYVVPDLPSTDEVLPYLRRIDAQRWYSNFGPLVCELEERLQALLTAADRTPQMGRVHLTTLVSGHHALQIGLRLSGITRGKRVLVPAVTFPSCPLAVHQVGAETVLADVDPVDWTLTPRIARAIAARARIDAVMPVAVYGVPLPSCEWDAFVLDTGIPVVIDAAAAIETQALPRHALVAHSLHATKPFGVGEGGVLAGRDPEAIARGRQYANFGMIDRISRLQGTNAKMSEYHAAVGLAQVERWGAVKRRRSQLLALYIQHLEPLLEFVSLQPSIHQAVVSSLMLLLKRPVADLIIAEANHAGIAVHRTYLPPLYRHPCFADLSLFDLDGIALPARAETTRKQSHMPNSEKLLAHLVGVPFHPFMSEADVAAVIGSLGAWIR
jgi:dTDP-4-amino-4,6-dideoxygalactose transaminase